MDLLKDLYYNTENATAFTSLEPLYQEAKKRGANITKRKVKEFLRDQETYTLHANARRNYPRMKIVSPGLFLDFQVDLCDMQRLKRWNSNVSYLLTAICVYSHKCFVVRLKSKRGEEVRDALVSIFHDFTPMHLTSDQGREFFNRDVQAFLKERGIIHRFPRSEMKASMIERFNRTLKNRIWRYMEHANTRRYLDKLQEIVENIHNSKNRSIGMAPNEVTGSSFLLKFPPPTKPLFKIGDEVRISKNLGIFKKAYEETWSQETFVVYEARPTTPPVYRIKDTSGEIIEGLFYNEELQKVTNSTGIYRIEKVLEKRKTRRGVELFVKWMGYPEPSWILEKNVVPL